MNFSKFANERVVFLVLTVYIYNQKTSDKHYIYPLGKTTVKAYENEVLNGSFLECGKTASERVVFLMLTVHI